MSRDPFGELVADEDKETYVRSEAERPVDLGSLMYERLTERLKAEGSSFPRRWETIFEEITRYPEPDAQSLVDSVIEAMQEDYPSVKEHPESLVNHLVQQLYREGYHGLRVDYSGFSVHGGTCFGVGKNLRGSWGDPLDVWYILPDRPEDGDFDVGEDAEHCRIKVSGRTHCSGEGARNSKFYHEVPPGQAGRRSSGSDFYLDNVERFSPWSKDRRLGWSTVTLRHQGRNLSLGVHVDNHTGGGRILIPDTAAPYHPKWTFLFYDYPKLVAAEEEGWLELVLRDSKTSYNERGAP